MTEEKSWDVLYNKYPNIFRDINKSPIEGPMSFGIECNLGWFDLLEICCEKIQYFCDLCTKKNKTEVAVVASQIKEKFGKLRFYYELIGVNNVQADIIDDIISITESKSSSICEITGKYGQLYHRYGWLKTLCKEEADKLGYERC